MKSHKTCLLIQRDKLLQIATISFNFVSYGLVKRDSPILLSVRIKIMAVGLVLLLFLLFGEFSLMGRLEYGDIFSL